MTELNGDRDVLVVVAVSIEPLHDGASVSTADSTQGPNVENSRHQVLVILKIEHFLRQFLFRKWSELSETPNPALEICKFAAIDGNFNSCNSSELVTSYPESQNIILKKVFYSLWWFKVILKRFSYWICSKQITDIITIFYILCSLALKIVMVTYKQKLKPKENENCSVFCSLTLAWVKSQQKGCVLVK